MASSTTIPKGSESRSEGQEFTPFQQRHDLRPASLPQEDDSVTQP